MQAQTHCLIYSEPWRLCQHLPLPFCGDKTFHLGFCLGKASLCCLQLLRLYGTLTACMSNRWEYSLTVLHSVPFIHPRNDIWSCRLLSQYQFYSHPFCVGFVHNDNNGRVKQHISEIAPSNFRGGPFSRLSSRTKMFDCTQSLTSAPWRP